MLSSSFFELLSSYLTRYVTSTSTPSSYRNRIRIQFDVSFFFVVILSNRRSFVYLFKSFLIAMILFIWFFGCEDIEPYTFIPKEVLSLIGVDFWIRVFDPSWKKVEFSSYWEGFFVSDSIDPRILNHICLFRRKLTFW